MHLKSAIPFATFLFLAPRVHAGAVPTESIDSFAKKSEIIVVGQIVKVEPVSNSNENYQGIPAIHQRATIKILRGIQTADAKPLPPAPDSLIIDFLTYDGTTPFSSNNGPTLPNFSHGSLFGTGTIAVFPLKRITPANTSPSTFAAPTDLSTAVWHFVNEEGYGLALPALAAPLNAAAPASAKDFLYRELAAGFIHGDNAAIARSAGYLTSTLNGSKLDQTICTLIEPEIHDDTRWVDIAVASYCQFGQSGFTIADFRTDKPRYITPHLIIQLALKKANPENLHEHLLRSMVAHQGDFNRFSVSEALTTNFNDDPLMFDLERAALAGAQPGALDVANTMIGGVSTHPLVAPAITAAKNAIAAAAKSGNPPELSTAVFLLMRHGSDQDIAFLLEQTKIALKQNLAAAETILQYPGVGADSRNIQLYRLYIDATTLVRYPHPIDLRLCDEAAFLLQRTSHQEFNFNREDPIAPRDQALAHIRTWLKSN